MTTASQINIFDRQLLRQYKEKAGPERHKYSFLFDWSEQQIKDRLSVIIRDHENALLLGEFSNDFRSERITRQFHLKNFAPKEPPAKTVIADEEFLPVRPGSLDLILANLNLHAINDVPGVFKQIKDALKPDGLFLGSLFGGETLTELRASLMHAEIALSSGASPRVFPFADKQDMGALLQRAGFALPVVDSEIVTVSYETMFHLMRDIKGMGENNIIRERARTYAGRELFMKAALHYQDNFPDKDGRIKASFEMIFMIGWAPHESQQKPLKPGSAKSRLAEALETQEIKTGDQTI